jgi:hypothetical protein
MANRALYIDSLLPMADRMAEKAQKGNWKATAEDGRLYRDIFLGLAHGDPQAPVTISHRTSRLAAFRTLADDWESGMLRLARMARKQDPEWFANWGGPPGKL